MEKNFILTKLGAFGLCNSDTDDDARQLREALSFRREFPQSKLKVQPLLITDGSRQSVGIEDQKDVTAYSCSGLFYQVTIDDEIGSSPNLFDAIHAALAILEYSDHDILLVPIDPSAIPENRILPLSVAAEIYKMSLPYASQFRTYETVFLSQWRATYYTDKTLWELVSRIINDEQIIYAANFLRTTYENYQFFGDSIDEVILAHNEVPQHIREAVTVENAIHNCYKVVEAIYGGTLPGSDKKIKEKFAKSGIDTDKLAGYERFGVFKKEKIIDKIKFLRSARNEKAGHGRIHKDRKSTYYELMDYQALASNMLLMFVAHRYPDLGLWGEDDPA